MKKLLLTLALCLPFVLCAPLTAFAAEETAAEEQPAGEEQEGEEESFGWARITKEGVYLYRSADESSGLFILPRSYFVKITGEAGSFYAAEYLSGEAGRTAVRLCAKASTRRARFCSCTMPSSAAFFSASGKLHRRRIFSGLPLVNTV